VVIQTKSLYIVVLKLDLLRNPPVRVDGHFFGIEVELFYFLPTFLGMGLARVGYGIDRRIEGCLAGEGSSPGVEGLAGRRSWLPRVILRGADE